MWCWEKDKYKGAINKFLNYWRNNRELYTSCYPVREPYWADSLDMYRPPCSMLTPKVYSKEVKEVAIGNIYQSFDTLGLEAFNQFESLFTKEEKINILWGLYSIEVEKEIAPDINEWVDHFTADFGCWVEEIPQMTISAHNIRK